MSRLGFPVPSERDILGIPQGSFGVYFLATTRQPSLGNSSPSSSSARAGSLRREPMFRTLIISGSLLVLFLGGLFFQFGTVTPCGILKHEMSAQRLNPGRSYALPGGETIVLLDEFIETQTSWKCLKCLVNRATPSPPRRSEGWESREKKWLRRTLLWFRKQVETLIPCARPAPGPFLLIQRNIDSGCVVQDSTSGRWRLRSSWDPSPHFKYYFPAGPGKSELFNL